MRRSEGGARRSEAERSRARFDEISKPRSNISQGVEYRFCYFSGQHFGIGNREDFGGVIWEWPRSNFSRMCKRQSARKENKH